MKKGKANINSKGEAGEMKQLKSHVFVNVIFSKLIYARFGFAFSLYVISTCM